MLPAIASVDELMRDFLGIAARILSEARWLTRQRLLLTGSACTFVTIGLLGLYLLACFGGPGLTNSTGEHFGSDFVQFWSSAQLAAAGRSAAVYVLQPHQTIDQVFPYPPVVMLLCRPLAGLSYAPAVLVWGGLGLALFTVMLSRLVGWEMAVFAAVGTPAACFNLYLQQNGYYTAVLLGGGLMLLETRPGVAGILFGMLCCKPQLGVLLLPALIAGRQWRALFVAALTTLGLAAASAALFGPEIWIDFFGRTLLQSRWMEGISTAWPWTPTVFAMMRLLGASSAAAYIFQGLSTICAAAGVALLWRGRGSIAIKAAGLVTATFLATSYAWAYDAVVLTLAAAWLANDAVETGFRPWEKTCVLVLLTLAALSVIPAKLLGLQLGPILLWLALAVIMRRGLDWRLPVPANRPPRGLPAGSAALH
jgi:hypothetical protein